MLEEFREEVRVWLADNCSESLKRQGPGSEGDARERPARDDVTRWFDACYERGWTVPGWPREYGGAALNGEESQILREEMNAAHAPAPLVGMGVTMIGPTLLEYGTDAQKAEHLPRIASGEVRWCQGYSEPGAGSDLASLQTRAEDHGDYYLINGSKIWTSGADQADWMFCLVRTDPKAPKHEGISFVLFSMDDPGVTVKPIVLIAGSSAFCQCFFDDVKALKSNLVGQENRGWTIAKRLLQHERSSISSPGGFGGGESLVELALRYSQTAGGTIADSDLRREVAAINMDAKALGLTQRRATEENHSGGTPTFVTSLFKYYSTELATRRSEASIRLMGTQGVGWDGAEFSAREQATTRFWLFGKALTIAGGSSEVQLNIIAKRVLGLPD
ncbi:MAG: acyl-CoA dehydrogenase family protein [Gammaproteobacteria bacterium]|nr:acyl-CoA dehydrogenase family protein [Gammaproteobacteria bacterium]